MSAVALYQMSQIMVNSWFGDDSNNDEQLAVVALLGSAGMFAR